MLFKGHTLRSVNGKGGVLKGALLGPLLFTGVFICLICEELGPEREAVHIIIGGKKKGKKIKLGALETITGSKNMQINVSV